MHLTRRLVHSAYFFRTKRSRTLLRLKTIQITSFFMLAKPLKITKTQFLTKFAPGRDIEQKDKSCFFIQNFPPAGTSTKRQTVSFQKIRTSNKNILPNLIRNLNTPQNNFPKYKFDPLKQSVTNWKFEDRIIEYFYCFME